VALCLELQAVTVAIPKTEDEDALAKVPFAQSVQMRSAVTVDALE
jgi:hypothetical protein